MGVELSTIDQTDHRASSSQLTLFDVSTFSSLALKEKSKMITKIFEMR